MAYKKTISDTTRAYVLFLGKEKRYSCRAIAKKARISKASVSLILRGKVQRKQYLKTCKKIGRPKKLSDRDRRKLITIIKTLRDKDPNFTGKRLVVHSGLLSRDISYQTFYREVKAAGFDYLPALKKGVLTSRDHTSVDYNGRQSAICRTKTTNGRSNLFRSDILTDQIYTKIPLLKFHHLIVDYYSLRRKKSYKENWYFLLLF
jgi:transposase